MEGKIMDIWLAYALGGVILVVIGLWAYFFMES